MDTCPSKGTCSWKRTFQSFCYWWAALDLTQRIRTNANRNHAHAAHSYVGAFSLGTRRSLTSRCLFFSISTTRLHSPPPHRDCLFLYFTPCVLLAPSSLRAASCSLHTLFSSARSENAIIECLGKQLDQRGMLFLPSLLHPLLKG